MYIRVACLLVFWCWVTAVSWAADTVVLTWTPNTEADLAGYRVERAPSCNSTSWSTVGTVSSTTMTDTSPLSPTSAYRVRAYDTTNNISAPSACAQVTISSPTPPTPPPPPPTTPPPPPPPPPSDGYSIASVTPSATTILVNSSANITFMLNQAATSNFAIPIAVGNPSAVTVGASNCVVLTGSRSCAISVTGLAAGVSTVTGTVNGVGSASVVTVTTAGSGGGGQPLSPPVLLSPSASAVFDSTTTVVTFTWQAMAGAASYRFRLLDETDGTVNTSVLCPGVKICLNDLTSTTSGPHAVTAGHNYSWWVHWVDSSGTVSEASGRTFSINSGSGAPAPPSVRLIATAADVSTASIEWDAVAGTANYKVYRRAEDETSWTFIATTSATSTTVAIPGAGTYLIRVNITLLNGTEVTSTQGVWVTR